MARVKLDFGAEVDFLTKGELDDSLGKFEELWRSYAEGLKWIRPSGVLAAATGVVQSPREGFAWMLTLVSATTSAAATVTVAIGETGEYPVGTETLAAAGSAVLTWSSRQVILLPDDKLWLGASAGTISHWRVHAIEAPAEQIFKLIGG